MGNIIKLSAILFLVAGIASGSLAFYNSFTKPEIDKLKAANEAAARKYVLKGLFDASAMDGLIFDEGVIEVNGSEEKFWKVKEKDSDLRYKAFVFLCKEQGFSGVVETMVGADGQMNINGIKVIKHTETPGLGAESQTVKYGDDQPYFETWFKGKNAMRVVVEKDDPNSKDKVQSLTGATITTRAVCKSINKYAELVRKELEVPTVIPEPGQIIDVQAELEKHRKAQEEKEAQENAGQPETEEEQVTEEGE